MPMPRHRFRHRSSIFLSSLTNILSTRPSQPPSSTQPFGEHTSDRVHSCDGFEGSLAQRLTLLLPDDSTAAFVRLPSLRLAMAVLLQTMDDLRASIATLKLSLSSNQHHMILYFLDRTDNLFDACIAIREGVLEVEKWEQLLELTLQLLQKRAIKAHLQRSRKLLWNVRCAMSVQESREEKLQVQHRSFRWRNLASSETHEPQRWSSWHGNLPSSVNKALFTNSSSPKNTDIDMDDCFAASLYAFQLVSSFFLGTIMAALPCQCKSLSISVTHPWHFLWTIPLLNLQDRVVDEMRKNRKGMCNTFLSELHRIFLHVCQLFDFTDKALITNTVPLSAELHEEMEQIVVPLSQHIKEIQTDMGPLAAQVNEFFHCLIKVRVELMDLLRQANA